MKVNYIFLAGMEKSGTSALAGWLTSQGLARHMVSGRKESHQYVHTDFPPTPLAAGDCPWLDASVSYSVSPHAVNRLPEHGAKIALCLRNPLERTWSAYRMKKIIALQSDEASTTIRRYNDAAQIDLKSENSLNSKLYEDEKSHFIRIFPRSISKKIEQNFDDEIERLRSGTFIDRINYEMEFLMSRRSFPFMSILISSFCYYGIRPFLDRYQPEDMVIVSLGKLRDKINREKFTCRLTGKMVETDDIKFGFSTSDLNFNEPDPIFTENKFDSLRSALSYDQQQFRQLLEGRGVATDLVDWDDLQRYLA